MIYGHDAALARWAGDRLGIKDFGPCTCIGVAHKNAVVAVAVFNHYNWPDIHITFVTSSPRWASPGAVKAILSYPFVQLRCKRITAVTATKNRVTRLFLHRLGFREEGYHPDVFAADDAISYGLLKKNATRWIDEGLYERLITAAGT